MKFEEKVVEIFKQPMCDNCAGRIFGNLLSGMTNEERGKILRNYVAFLLDSGEKIDVDTSNFHGMKFRNAKPKTKKPEKCSVCKNFFREKINEVANSINKKLKDIEFETFLIGSIPTDEMQNAEEKIWEKIGADFSELIKSEINREVGKIVEKITGKKFELEDPDVTILVDLKNDAIRFRIKSLFIAGGYKKLVRGIPQTKWICPNCMGKGCIECKGVGKLYKSSVQEIIANPIMKLTDGKDSAFHGSGREDIDVRCLDYRPFVIEILKPLKRKIDLEKAMREINKSKTVKVSALRFSDKNFVRKIKTDRYEKTYYAEVVFVKKIDKKKLKEVSKIIRVPIEQKTPTRVSHRRANLLRKRSVKKISYKIVNSKKILFKIRAESGLYIKELINGDEGRTKPSIAEILNNKVKKISLDVVKIHTK